MLFRKSPLISDDRYWGKTFSCDAVFLQNINLASHKHPELEVNLILSGSGKYLIDEAVIHLRPNDMLWLFPEQKHVLYEGSDDFSMAVIVFNPEMIQTFIHEEANKPIKNDHSAKVLQKNIEMAAMGELTKLFQNLENSEDESDQFNSTLFYLLMRSWYHFNASSVDANSAIKIHSSVAKAAFLIKQNPEMSDLEELATIVGLSESRLIHLFSEQMGFTITDYRNRSRLDLFVQTYKNNKTSITETMLESGFGSYAQFHRIFKKYMNASPREWIKNQKVLSESL